MQLIDLAERGFIPDALIRIVVSDDFSAFFLPPHDQGSENMARKFKVKQYLAEYAASGTQKGLELN